MKRWLSRRPILAGLLAFLIVWLGLGLLIGSTTCRDGWQSPSIGRRGACSHHGGVDRTAGEIIRALAIGAGWITWAALNGYAERKYREENPPVFTPRCPRCSSIMRRRRARRGRNAGNEFWGCSAYPSCKGTRAMESPASRNSSNAS
jgi:hypothetical protein